MSCPATRLCIAVGGYLGRSGSAEYQPLAEEWDGRQGRILPAPNPDAENGSSFVAIDCRPIASGPLALRR